MTAQIISITHIPGRCRSCETTRYTVAELNVRPGRPWTCYQCLDVLDRRHEADALAYAAMGLDREKVKERIRATIKRMKEPQPLHFAPVWPQHILDELKNLPVTDWDRWKRESATVTFPLPWGDETPPKDA
ncbi:hypothetical protein [Sphingobium yanoikuyae]|uniref:hypothetical protein n=1 Tax=Sphingobium yanoikuyae TaxID=13690 RepID=UPI0035C73911